MKSKDRILNAAIPIFAQKGRHGARMEEIAGYAHINKAMIYYIFHSKDTLYLEALKFVFEKAFESISSFFDKSFSKKNYVALLTDFITAQFTFFNENRNYTKILVDAMSNGANEISIAVKYLKTLQQNNEFTSNQISRFIEKGKSEKFFRNIDTDQLMISIIGMIMIYFLSHSITESLDIDIKDEASFMETRRKSIIDLVLHGIMN